jgi:CorA-like Mg2+ transporter protein
LLDATLGPTNIDQNNIFRILTVVSVIGIPPIFVGSMYGMNFKNIPEYDWSFGYQYGLLPHRVQRDRPDHMVQMARLVVDAEGVAARGWP